MSGFPVTGRVAIVIPAYNESGAIANVVTSVSHYGTAIVVNDGSSDNTGQIAKEAGAIVLDHETNHGYDLALCSGLSKAIADSFDFVITIDGDGQHQPSYIGLITNELLTGADIVVGTRDRFQRFSEVLFSILSTALWRISDPLCGIKGYRVSRLSNIDTLYSYASVGTELLIRAKRSGWEIRELPVTTRARRDQSRFGSGLSANWSIIKAMLIGAFCAGAYTGKNTIHSKAR